jgi:glycine cleavage system H protein
MVRYFNNAHVWVRLEGDTAVVGISDYAQSQLGDAQWIELPEVGRSVVAGKEVAVVESVKAASEILSPVSGEVIERNEALKAEPTLVNSAPEGEGWLFKLKLADAGELEGLMGEAAYSAFVVAL